MQELGDDPVEVPDVAEHAVRDARQRTGGLYFSLKRRAPSRTNDEVYFVASASYHPIERLALSHPGASAGAAQVCGIEEGLPEGMRRPRAQRRSPLHHLMVRYIFSGASSYGALYI